MNVYSHMVFPTRPLVVTLTGLALAARVAGWAVLDAQASGPAMPSQPAPRQSAAAALPFPADARVALVNLQAVLGSSQMGQAGQAQLKTLGDKWASNLQALADKARALQQELQAEQATLSTTTLAQKRADLSKAQLELQYQQQQRDSEMQTLSDQLSNQFEMKVLPIIETIRQERKLWVVLEVGETPVAASDPAIDLSAEVTKRLDAAK